MNRPTVDYDCIKKKPRVNGASFNLSVIDAVPAGAVAATCFAIT